MIEYKYPNNQKSIFLHISHEKKDIINDKQIILKDFLQNCQDINFALIELSALAEDKQIILLEEDVIFLNSLLDDKNYYYHSLLFLNKLSSFQENVFIQTPFNLYSHLFQLLEINPSNLLFSTVGNFVSISEEFAEFSIDNNIINAFLCKYSCEQQDMIPWIAICFLCHKKIYISTKIYTLIDHIMENIGLIIMNSEINQRNINNYLQLSYKALAQFIEQTCDYSYFKYHFALPRNITINIDDDDSNYEKYNFIYSITKNTSKFPKNFPYISFFGQSMKDLSDASEKTSLVILGCIYNVQLKQIFLESIIQTGLFDYLQENAFSASFSIKNIIVKIISGLIANTSLTIKIIELLNPNFFYIIQDFPDSFDECMYTKLSNTFSLISDKELKLKIKHFMQHLIECHDGQIYFQNK